MRISVNTSTIFKHAKQRNRKTNKQKQKLLNSELLKKIFRKQKQNQLQSESEKDQFEVQMYQAIQSLEIKLNDIQKMVNVQFNDQNQQMTAHVQIVISCLYKKLNSLSILLQNYKFERYKKVNKYNNLINIHNNNHQNINQNHNHQPQSEELPSDLNQQELNIQKQQILRKYNNEQQKVEQNQQKLVEISQLIAKFSSKIQEQDQLTEKIIGDASDSLKNVELANKNLSDANKYSSGFGQLWFYYFMSMAFFLLIYDYLKA